MHWYFICIAFSKRKCILSPYKNAFRLPNNFDKLHCFWLTFLSAYVLLKIRNNIISDNTYKNCLCKMYFSYVLQMLSAIKHCIHICYDTDGNITAINKVDALPKGMWTKYRLTYYYPSHFLYYTHFITTFIWYQLYCCLRNIPPSYTLLNSHEI